MPIYFQLLVRVPTIFSTCTSKFCHVNGPRVLMSNKKGTTREVPFLFVYCVYDSRFSRMTLAPLPANVRHLLAHIGSDISGVANVNHGDWNNDRSAAGDQGSCPRDAFFSTTNFMLTYPFTSFFSANFG